MPKQDISVRQLVDKVLSRELALPEMQRRYVWTGVKVRDLLDSLYRGYPSGAILVWEADPTLQDRSLQVGGVQSDSVSGKLLLLDGQQRLTSLTAILSGQPIIVRNKKKPIEILFNLNHPDTLSDEFTEADEDDDEDDDDEDDSGTDDERDVMEEVRKRTFVVGTRSLKNDPNWVSVSEVFNKTEAQLLRPLKINSDDPNWDKYSERIKNLKKIEDYPYVMQILDKRLSYAEVTEIFVRVNSLGAKLRGSDLALAQITSKWKGFITDIDSFASTFENNQDYLLDSGVLVKSLIVFATNQSKFKTVNKIPLATLKAAWEKAKAGLSFAINLIRNNARVDNLNLLVSSYLLIPIAYYVVQKKERLSKAEEKKVMLWFYVAHMKGHFSTSSETVLDVDISVLNRTQDLDQLLATLKGHVRDFGVSVDEISGKGRRSAYFSLLFMIAKQQGIQDWSTGMAISERLYGKAHALQFHHIFPKALLKKAGKERREINEIANLAFIGGRTNRNISDKAPSTYLPKIIEKREDVLESHLLPSDSNLWEVKNFDEFIKYRRERIVKTINSFLKPFDANPTRK